MGFFSRKPVVATCDMCGKPKPDGCRGLGAHMIWMDKDGNAEAGPSSGREGSGSFTFLCVRCDSFPDMHWPTHAGALAGMLLHLGSVHRAGRIQGGRQNLNMVPMSVGRAPEPQPGPPTRSRRPTGHAL